MNPADWRDSIFYSMMQLSHPRRATMDALQLMAISLEAYDCMTSVYDSSGCLEG